MDWFRSGIAALVTVGGLALGAHAQAQSDENVMIVFDGSNSMWGQIDGVAKIEIARGVMENLLGGWTDERSVGLMAYGHRQRGDCTDIETLIAPAAGTRGDILSQINGITPTGKTPLTDAVEQAARAMSYEDTPATVILISDGLESCERDPCALAEALEKGGVGFTAHVVGFGLGGDADTASLSCIAEKTGGEFLSAANAEELGNALSAVSVAVAETPEPEPVVEPEPEPEPAKPEVAVSGPETAIKGSMFDVSWDPTIAKDDYIAIVPMGADEGTYGNYQLVRDYSTVQLRAPADVGLYELRYIQRADGATLGRATIEVTEPEVTVSGPDSVITGADFKVTWTGTVANDDYIAIVPMGADEGTYGNYQLVRDFSETTLKAQAETGMYELRYILREGGKTLATQMIEVTEPEVTVSGPERVVTGEDFTASWTGTVAENDYIAIVPVGSEEGTYGNYQLVRDKSEITLKAQADPGMYELRYILREGGKTLATQMIEVAEPEVTVSGPETALAGAVVRLSWTGAVAENDYIAIVPAGADEGTYGTYQMVRDKTEHDLVMPGDTGLYEIRYILREGAKTLASQMIEATEPSVTLTAPEQVRIGDELSVGWSDAVNALDYINLAPMGSDDESFATYKQVRDKGSTKLNVPETEGMYELRYMLKANNRVIARKTIEVLGADAALNTGASLSAPETGVAGSVIEVGFAVDADSADQRITLAKADQAIFTWVTAVKVKDAGPVQITLPDAPGVYELRYLDLSNQAVLARQTITVE
ncbi:vWA domain-containing protein [Roseovarius sp. 2305UL8-3]|uniref:vWA domain-containing protein n=1 Tax=Roseovarius conchicola TaxID=3121636 RepID=UPI00352771D4